jgi:flavin reductase (DIM6/NTAB) family NADH-FMN oxidoreductase RutF
MTTCTSPTALDAATFRDVFRHYPNGVAVITAAGPDGPVGFTATSVTSISSDPPVLAFSIRHDASAWPTIETAASVVVHFLDTEHVALSQVFATSGIDRFAPVDWEPLPDGEPRLTDVRTWTRGSILHRVPAGGSTVVLVGPTRAEVGQDRVPLVYHDRHYHSLTPLSVLDGVEHR